MTSSGRLVVADGVSTGVEIVYGTPEIDSVDPPQVPLGGGVQLVIEGRNFAPETVVVVGGVLVAGARILDSSRISLVAPELPSGRHLITLHHRGGIAQRPLVVLPIPLDQLQPGEITTFAGGTSFAGEGEPANQAQLAFPDGIALAANGDLLVADTSNHRIRRVDAVTGLTFSVVGSGLEGFSPDGALAIASSLREPAGLALDRAGDLYFTDAARIRRVDARQGVIRTVAGGGFPADGVGDGGPASEARLDSGDLALDGRGNVYLADRFLHRVRRVDAMTGLITSVAGTGEQASTGDNGPATSATLNMPFGLAFDRTENLFIAEFLGRRIRRIDRESETIATVAGKSGFPGIGGEGGPATDALLGGPFDVAVDGSGNLFIADTDRVWRVDAASGIIEILAGGNGLGFSGDGDQAREARLNRPRSILLDGSSNIYICDTVNNRV
ncbi:MAG: IPT/TIG domain-containing protein [Acidobacteriota bacterium]